ncbi:UNVERIFIED_ORG: hypothetical protein QE448_003707 [Rhizobium sp. SORGH_AS285]|nr:hypothetical protein [Rhizobium sp. SORGH_AS_0285]
MLNRVVILSSFALLASAAFVSPAAALTMKECSVKYQAAKADAVRQGHQVERLSRQVLRQRGGG